jgi:putative tryptophan/tyrosine transport system substrate-binding protein
MKTKILFLFLLLTALPLLSACGSNSPKVYHVGILNGLDFFSASVDGFQDKMAELGFIEGKNIIYDIQTSAIDEHNYTKLINGFVNSQVDLIFTFPTEATMIAKQNTKDTDIPVLFVNANIEDTGLIDSVREPGGNITGVRYPGPDLALKTMEMTKEILPATKKIAIFHEANYPIVKSQMKILNESAPKLGVEITEIIADDTAELKTKIAELDAAGKPDYDVIMLIAGVLATSPETFSAIAEFADRQGVPVTGAAIPVAGHATLFNITTDIYKTGALAAPFAKKIFAGISAGTIPVVSSEPYVTVNTVEAKRLGIKIPDGVLSIADNIIK